MIKNENNKEELPEGLPPNFAAGVDEETRKGLSHLARACAVAAANSRKGVCEWAFCATQLFVRLEQRGLQVARLYFAGGWNAQESFEKGEFSFCYCGKTVEEAAGAVEKIAATLQEMEDCRLLEIEHINTREKMEPCFFIKAKILCTP